MNKDKIDDLINKALEGYSFSFNKENDTYPNQWDIEVDRMTVLRVSNDSNSDTLFITLFECPLYRYGLGCQNEVSYQPTSKTVYSGGMNEHVPFILENWRNFK